MSFKRFSRLFRQGKKQQDDALQSIITEDEEVLSNLESNLAGEREEVAKNRAIDEAIAEQTGQYKPRRLEDTGAPLDVIEKGDTDRRF